jgi:hypothetical protein
MYQTRQRGRLAGTLHKQYHSSYTTKARDPHWYGITRDLRTTAPYGIVLDFASQALNFEGSSNYHPG